MSSMSLCSMPPVPMVLCIHKGFHFPDHETIHMFVSAEVCTDRANNVHWHTCYTASMIEYIACRVIPNLPQTKLRDLVTPPTNDDALTMFSDRALVASPELMTPDMLSDESDNASSNGGDEETEESDIADQVITL